MKTKTALFCFCGNRFNPKDRFCTNCGGKKPRKKRGIIRNIFFVICLAPFVALLGFALVNLSDFAVEYLPYLSDQKAFQAEWNWEVGFDQGYRCEGTLNALLNSDPKFSSDVNSDYKKGYLAGKATRIEEIQGKLILRDPSYQEMKEFLKNDLVNRRTWTDPDYVCANFSIDTVNHAKAKGIKSGYVYLDFRGNPDHAIICFQTTDQGLIFIEPQLDKEVKVKIGRNYWGQNTRLFQINIGNVSGLSYDDTIVSIKITWSDGSITVITEN